MWANRKLFTSRSAASIAGNAPPALADRVLDEAGDDPAAQFVDAARLLEPGIAVLDLAHEVVDEGDGADVGQAEQTRPQAVVDVVGVIGDVVCDRRSLRLEARVGGEAERLDSIVFEDRRRHAARPVTLGRRA